MTASARMKRKEGTVILAIDVSGSMLAEDMKPNRMEAAKAPRARSSTSRARGVKIGVVSFSATPRTCSRRRAISHS